MNSRDLYVKQFNEAKENLTNAQHQLMIEQKAATEAKVEVSIKDQEISMLKEKMEEQLRRSFHEKDELVRRLEELNVELKDGEDKVVQENGLQVTTRTFVIDYFMIFILILYTLL